jgi:hypothetical protein
MQCPFMHKQINPSPLNTVIIAHPRSVSSHSILRSKRNLNRESSRLRRLSVWESTDDLCGQQKQMHSKNETLFHCCGIILMMMSQRDRKALGDASKPPMGHTQQQLSSVAEGVTHELFPVAVQTIPVQ